MVRAKQFEQERVVELDCEVVRATV